MTPNRNWGNNAKYSAVAAGSNNGGGGSTKGSISSSSNVSGYFHSYSQHHRRSQIVTGVTDHKNHQTHFSHHPHQSKRLLENTYQQTFPEKPKRKEIEFIPSFALVDATRENNERKVREICQKLDMLNAEESEPVINFQDQTGRTALSYGCGSGNITIMDEISRFKFADPNLPDNDGNGPLHYSSVCGHCEGIDLLLARFPGVIDVNARNTSGLTPLMKAALQGRTRCAKSLLAAGAAADLRDYIRGMTAAEWAILCGRHMCAEIINRSATKTQQQDAEKRHSSSLVYSSSGMHDMHEDDHVKDDSAHLSSDEMSYYHLYTRTTVSGAKWLKNKIKKVLGASIRSGAGEDKSFVCDNPLVRSLANRRPTMPDRNNYTVLTNMGLRGATICASSMLVPDVKPLVEQQHRQRAPPAIRKIPVPVVQITPVRSR